MSVLVEALSLIIPRTVLDASYPGGANAFLQSMSAPTSPCHLTCADDQLVSVSFQRAEQAEVVEGELRALGIVSVEDDHFRDLAFVDHALGPTMPCDWIEWTRHQDGLTSCWLAGSNPDPLHVPENWTRAQASHRDTSDVRDEPGRCLTLADKDGRETWLDFTTGEVVTGTSRSAPAPESVVGETGALLAVVKDLLDGQGYPFQQHDAQSLSFRIRHEQATYLVFCSARDETHLVQMTSGYSSFVPPDRRSAIAEAVSRINRRIGYGNFELDYDDGEIRFRVGIDVDGGALVEQMANNMLGCTMFNLERFHQALMRIAFGDADPARAIAEAA